MIIGVGNAKGGVGKTTDAIHLAAYLQTLAPTLLVDGDHVRAALAATRGRAGRNEHHGQPHFGPEERHNEGHDQGAARETRRRNAAEPDGRRGGDERRTAQDRRTERNA